MATAVSQASQSEEIPVQQSSQLLLSSATNESEGIPIKKLLPEEDDGSAGDNTNSVTVQGTDGRPADSSEIRKRRLERLVSKEAGDQPQQTE